MTGVFITFEGIEGCGKTTQIKLLADHLRREGRKVVVTREPGGTPIGDQIRQILLGPHNHAMTGVTELFLYAAGRAQHVAEVIRPAIATGHIVLCDRYADATSAYQGAARGIDQRELSAIHAIATGNLKPDLTLLFDCPVDVGLHRARERNKKGLVGREDRFEQETLDFHQCVRDGYLKLAQDEPKRFVVIDATETPDAIEVQVIREVMKKLKPMEGSS